MNDRQIVEYLRARGQVTPPVDFTRSVMAAVDSAPAAASAFSPFIPAFVAVVAAAAVAALALLIGPGRDIGLAPSASAGPTATPSASGSGQPQVGEVEGAVMAALDRLADAPGVQGTVTSEVEDHLASATWFDWRPNGDQVVVTRTDVDVAAPWWTDPDGEPLTVGERIRTEMSAITADEFYRADEGVWVADETPRGPLTFWTGVLDGEMPVFAGFPEHQQADRRDLADGTTVWVLVSGSDDVRTIAEWTIDPRGVLTSATLAIEQPAGPEQAGSTNTRVEFTRVEDPGPIPTPEIGAPADPVAFGLPDDFPLAPPIDVDR